MQAVTSSGETRDAEVQTEVTEATSTGDTSSELVVFQAPRISTPVVVPVIGSDDKDDNPTLTHDLLEIYFTSTRGGDSDVWFATRPNADSDFGEPIQVSVVNTTDFESSPAIERDGLTLWFARRVGKDEDEEVESDLDIYRSRRPSRESEWAAPELVSELRSDGDDIPRPPGAGGLVMPLSVRPEGDTYHLYLATRETEQGNFGTPSLIEPLLRDDYGSVDGFVTWDGKYLLFAYTKDELGDLFIAPRNDSGFTEPLPLSDINTEFDERDPWVSADGTQIFFASDRDETLRIYQAALIWQ